MNNVLEHTINAARLAGDYLRQHALDGDGIEYKKVNDPVTPHDRAAERIMRAYLDEHAPGNHIGEEYGEENLGLARTYIHDPIDGTKEWLLRGFQCSTSIGIEENGELVGGVVHDFMRGITYAGYRSETFLDYNGARIPLHRPQPLSKRRIEITKNSSLKDRLPSDRYSTSEKGGSIALSLAELAAGNYDGVISPEIGKGNIWDVAAGAYLCKAVGIEMWDAYGNPFDHHNAKHGFVGVRPEISDDIRKYCIFMPQSTDASLRT
jgi:myo-inositol-1(or 4)-monophosphatase